MGIGLRELLSLPIWRAFDIDEEGRVLAGHDAEGTLQLVELAPDGTATRLTDLPGVRAGRYLPGTRTVVVEHDKDGNERAQLSLLALDEATLPTAAEGLTALVRDERYIHNLVDVDEGRIVYTTNRRNTVDFDVVVRDTATGAETVVYDQGGMTEAARVSKDGTRVIVIRPGAAAMSDQLLLAAVGGAARPLTAAGESAQYAAVRWLPDGSLLASTDRDRDHLAVVSLDPATGALTELVAAEDHDVYAWASPDGRTLLVMTNDDGAARLALHDAATGAEVRAVDVPEGGWTADPTRPAPVWSPDSRSVAISYTSPTVPGDILRLDAETGALTTLVDSTTTLGGAKLVRPVAYRVPTPDGESVPCYVYQSPDPVDPELVGSAVLFIHGGPESQSVLAFNPLVQGLAAAGHAVLVPNVRGSTGYGKRWYSADDVSRRLDSVADLAALHAWLPELGLDQARAALWGGSYGGYMVLAGLAFQPELWSAGIDIVGMSSLVTFLRNTSAYRRTAREREYGSLEHDLEFLESASPLNRIDDIRAPLFVIHGANDPRVPLGEAEQLVASLRANEVPCDLLVYPDEGHGLAKRENRLDAYPRAVEFLARHLSRR